MSAGNQEKHCCHKLHMIPGLWIPYHLVVVNKKSWMLLSFLNEEATSSTQYQQQWKEHNVQAFQSQCEATQW